MSRRRKKPVFHGKDASQDAIVAALKAIGASVHDMSRVGGGFPDLAVGYQNRNYFLEAKPETGTKKQLNLRETQVKWHAAWKGQVAKVHTPEEAIAIVTNNQ